MAYATREFHDVGDLKDFLAANDVTIVHISDRPSSIGLLYKTGGPYQNDVAVTTAGTAEVAPTVADIEYAVIQALSANTGSIFVGDSGVTNAAGASPGIELAPGDSTSPIKVANLNALYVDVAVSGEGYSYLAW